MLEAKIDVNRVVGLLDLTSLNETDSEPTIRQLCQKAVTPLGPVAAVCIYPQFIELAKMLLVETTISVATVANFPTGDAPLTQVANQITTSLQAGADEIDVVVPYKDFLAGNVQSSILLVKTAKALCEKKILKVILETGMLSIEQIYELSCRVLESGADFIKTSTGKITQGATIEAAKAMFDAIKATNPVAGLKLSGGVKTPQQAQAYVELAQEQMGQAWCTARHLRIGASSLLDTLLKEA